jgi:integrase
MLIALIITAHLEHLRLSGYTSTTIYGRRRALARLEAALPVPLLAADVAILTAWRQNLRVTDQAIVAYVSHLRAFYGWCVKAGHLKTNPAIGIPVPKLGRRVPRPISEPDLMRALALAGPRVRPWLVLAGWAGLRAKEIAYLKRESILETNLPPVLLVAADATKGRTERIVPMSAFVVAELAAARLPAAGYAFRRGDDLVGPNEPWTISHLANEHLHDCGVGATLHQLRHRCGTMAYRASKDLRAVQELMGHASPSTTSGYAAYDRSVLAAAVESIPSPKRLQGLPAQRAAS